MYEECLDLLVPIMQGAPIIRITVDNMLVYVDVVRFLSLQNKVFRVLKRRSHWEDSTWGKPKVKLSY